MSRKSRKTETKLVSNVVVVENGVVYPKEAMVNLVQTWISEAAQAGIISLRKESDASISAVCLHAKIRTLLLDNNLISEPPVSAADACSAIQPELPLDFEDGIESGTVEPELLFA
jgi:hypothetical protein